MTDRDHDIARAMLLGWEKGREKFNADYWFRPAEPGEDRRINDDSRHRVLYGEWPGQGRVVYTRSARYALEYDLTFKGKS